MITQSPNVYERLGRVFGNAELFATHSLTFNAYDHPTLTEILRLAVKHIVGDAYADAEQKVLAPRALELVARKTVKHVRCDIAMAIHLLSHAAKQVYRRILDQPKDDDSPGSKVSPMVGLADIDRSASLLFVPRNVPYIQACSTHAKVSPCSLDIVSLPCLGCVL